MPTARDRAPKPAPVAAKPFGKMPDGSRIHLYTLANRNGVQVRIADYGATVVSLHTPDRDGRVGDVVLGFSSIEPYFDKSPYFGAILGRYGNRIGKARFTLDGKTYRLAKNSGPNSLHGGLKGFNKRLWSAEVRGPNCVRFSRLSPDGEEGYPGNLKVAVTYTLNERNELRLNFTAQTDKPTVLNLGNHSFFNLAGAGNGSILGHEIKIHASRYNPVDKNILVTGETRDVAGTPMDLREWTTLGANIQAVGGDPVGYDHNFVLDRWPVSRPALAVEVREPKSGRVMNVYTDQPGVQLYTSNFLDGTIRGKGGKVYRQHDAFCVETQHFPDSPNHPEFPTTVLRPGEMFRSTTVFRFGVR